MYNFIELCKVFIVWPVIVLILCLIFRKPISELLYRIKNLSFGKVSLDFFEKDVNLYVSTKNAANICITEQMAPSLSSNYYWLGHDLMWTINALMVGKDKSIIIHGLTQSIKQANPIFSGTGNWIKEISSLLDSLIETTPNEINSAYRNVLINRLWNIKNQMGKEFGPGFDNPVS